MSEELSGRDAAEEDDGVSLTPQQRAALELDHNVAITAGAGTGKTTTLTERYREILTTCPEVDPENVLTLTFTNDATSEMRDRIREMIDEELAAADPDEYDRWRRAKDGLEDAYVHTVHAFCSRVLREFAVEASVHPEFETLDEGDAGALVERAVTAVLDRHGGGAERDDRLEVSDDEGPTADWELEDELAALTRVYSRSRLAEALESLFGERPDSVAWAERWTDQTPADYVAYLSEIVEVSIAPDEADELIETAAAREAIDELFRLADRDLDVPADDAGKALLDELTGFLAETGAHTPDGETIDRQRFLLAVADGVTSGSGSRYSRAHYYAGSKGTWQDHGLGDERAALKDALDALADVVEPEARNLDHDPVVARNGARQAIALARVFRAARAEYRRLKRRRTALDYSDLIAETIAFLEDHEPARRALRDQFEFVMVDEVQDTDPRQWRLVKLLSGDDPERFDGRNVFLVGDEKQSIYRFRDADVTQFREARSTLVADNPPGVDGELELTGNFRTVDPALTVVDELFEEVLQPAAREEEDEDDTGAREHEPYEAEPQWLDARRQEGTGIDGTVEYMVVPDDEDADAALGLAESWYTDGQFVSRAEREAEAVAARLTRLFADGTEVYDREREACVPARPRHVAILFRSSRRLAAFERALDDHGVPYANLAGDGFYDAPEVLPLVNLLRVFEDPTADVPLYGVLRSPLFGFADETIAAAREPDACLWEGLATADPSLAAARERIAEWRAAAGLGDEATVGRWSTLVSRIVDETGYLVGVGADDRPRQAVANVEQFRERLRNWEEGSARSVTDLLDRIERAREGDEDPGEATVPGDVEGVQLRTVHSAKGLEFPVVVVPELTRRFNMRSSIPGAHLERIDGEPVLGTKAPAAGDAHETASTATYLHVRRHHRSRERAEQRRLLYVAATRARDHLLLSGTHGVDAETDSGLAAPGDWAEAWTWSDWVQPTLLDEADLVSRLADQSAVETTIGEGPYAIRRPTPPADWSPTGEESAVPSDVEIPAPDSAQSRTHLSATAFRDRLAGVSDRPAVLREPGADRAAPATAERATRITVDDEAAVDALDAATVGTVVHKLCEIGPPRSEWPAVVRRCVDDPGAVTDATVDAIADHAEAGLAGLAAVEEGYTVESRHSELPVELSLEGVRVVGDADHLSVTGDGYLVVDYKTSDLEDQSVAALTEHYLPQLVAYAGALVRNDESAETVEVALVFTDAGEVRRRSLSRGDVDELLDWATDHL